MKNRATKKKIVALFSMMMVLILLCGVLSSIFSLTVSATDEQNNTDKFEAYGLEFKTSLDSDKKALLVLSRLETIEAKIEQWNNQTSSTIGSIKNRYDIKDATKGLEMLNKEIPNLVEMFKDAQDGGDFDTARCINSSLATISSLTTMMGPYGQLASSLIDIANTGITLAMGGEEATSEAAQIEDRLSQQLDNIKNDIASIKGKINDLSNEINNSTNRIINAMPAALEHADDKEQIRAFLLRYEGNYSYNQFHNYLYGDTNDNSNSATAYYSLLQEALVNGESDKLVRRYYDDLYNSISSEIDDFEDYLAPGDSNIKSIIKTYYDYLSSNPQFDSKYGMTPEEATVQFAYELYQTELMADTLIMACNTYQYIQMLMNEQDYYESYNSTFVISKNQIENMYSTISARQDNISDQIAIDMAYVLGLNEFYLLEETDGTVYAVSDNETTFGNIFTGQTIYMNQMPEVVCDIFDFDIYDYSYSINSVAVDGYFKATTSNQNISVSLEYQEKEAQSMIFHANSSLDFTGGNGTKDDPYLISTKEQFMRINENLDKHYCLTRSIDLGGVTITPFGYSINSNGGEDIQEFFGTLDGNGYTISNATITGGTIAGLFCKISSDATVKNLTVANFNVQSTLTQAKASSNQFSIGTIAGENNGKIKNCVIIGNDLLDYSVSFTLNNSTPNRNINAYVGGIAGVNNNLVSSCKVEKLSVNAESNHSFGGDSTDSNKNNVYVGGLIGCNNGLLGYSSVDAVTQITAKSTSTLSPKTTVNPYVEALAGGICGKIGSHVPTNNMAKLYSAAKTSGNGSIEIVDSKWGKHYNNRKQNTEGENDCYIPSLSEERIIAIKCSQSEATSFFNSLNHQLNVDVSGLKETYKANESDFVYADMVVTVTDMTAPETVLEVGSSRIINIYGFLPYNTSFDHVKQKQAVILIQLTLKDGRDLITKKIINYSVDKNAIVSVEVEQPEKKFYADVSDTQILTSELNGFNNVKFICHLNSYTSNFDSEKLTDYTVKVEKCVRCEECGSYDVYSSVVGNNVAYECKEDGCHDTGFVAYKSYDSLFKGEIGKYNAIITGKYDGNDVEIVLNYTVYCPHISDETQYLTIDYTVDPTCASLGYTQYHCTHCGEVILKSYTSKTDVHVYEYLTDDKGHQPSVATCYKEGFTGKIVCSLCGDVKDEGHTIPKSEHDYSEIIYVYDGVNIMQDEFGNKVSYQHKCSHEEEDGSYHYENHQYKVTESVLPRTVEKNGIEQTAYYIVYTYSCDCGYSKQITDENLIVDENSNLPTVMVSNGYAVHGSDEVVVYVQLLNNPGIAGANFGIRYDSRLELKEYVYGDISENSITKDSNKVNFGCNFVWADVAYHTESGNLLKLVFIVPSDAIKGETYNVSIVYNIDNGASGGFTVDGKTQCFITRDAKITMVERLPGDVNNDGIVDLLDAIEIGQFLVRKKDSIEEKYANVDLSYKPYQSNVDISDMVIILQSMTGGYGVNLLSQEFLVVLNGNGYNLADGVLQVSIYNEYNNTYSRAGLKDLEQKGYKFDGWWTRLVGGEQIILADGSATGVKYFQYQKQQTLYAHWTLNSVTLDGNGATNDVTAPKLSYSDNYQTGAVQNHFEQEYKVTFVDTSKVSPKDSINEILSYSMIGWALSAEDAKNKVVKYKADLSDLNLEVSNLGAFTLYAVWDDGSLTFPEWNKQSIGYQDVKWFSNYEKSSPLDASDAKASNSIIKTLAVKNVLSEFAANVYAGFKPITYTIVFDKNGGEGSKTPEVNHDVENSSSLNMNTSISRVGYKFVGWSSTSDGKEEYSDGASVGYIPKTVRQEDGTYLLTLYAVWEPYKYGINYNINVPENAKWVKRDSTVKLVSDLENHNMYSDNVKYKIGVSYTLTPNKYSIVGWDFIGWSMNSDGSGTIYKDGSEIINLATCDGENETITLFAVWKVNTNTVGQNIIENGIYVSDTQGTNVYKVYNNIFQTPQITGDGRVIVDWSGCESGKYDYIIASMTSGERYGGGNTNLDIAAPVTEVIFIGNPDTKYHNVHIVHVNYSESAPLLTVRFVNFNIYDSGIGVWVNMSLTNPHKTMVLDVSGSCSVTAATNNTAIQGLKNLTITGNGTLTVRGGSGADGTTDGANGNAGGVGISVDNLIVDMTGNLLVYGGNGGHGYRGYNGCDGSDGSTGNGVGMSGWAEAFPRELINGGSGSDGSNGGVGGNGGDGSAPFNITKLINRCGNIQAYSGNGGNGSEGGTGGNGGNGGYGGYYEQYTTAVLTLANGGNGGKGGDGGDGGNAGKASINPGVIDIENHSEYVFYQGLSGSPGNGGDAGTGGCGGYRGEFYHISIIGTKSTYKSGSDGSDGSDGTAGENGH